MTHYLPLYFPEAERYYTNSRAQWFTHLLHRFPCPTAITRYSPATFEQEAWTLVGRKVNKRGFLADLYTTACHSIGLPVLEDCEAIQMFRLILAEHQQLCTARAAIEHQADRVLQLNRDYQRLRTLTWGGGSSSPSRSWRKRGIFAGFLITDNSSSFVGLISVHSSPDSSVA